MTTLRHLLAAMAIVAVTYIPAAAQQIAPQQATPPYGTPITLEQAKKVIAAAEAEAAKNNWFVVITVVDPGGYVVATHRLDNTQLGSIAVAEDKARTAVLFRRSSKVFEDAIANGGSGCGFSDCTEPPHTKGGYQSWLTGSSSVRSAFLECCRSKTARSLTLVPAF